MTTFTPEKIAEARALIEAATAGEWRAEACLVRIDGVRGAVPARAQRPEDAAFIAAAKAGWSAALDEIERLQARNVELEAGLNFYANPESYFAVGVIGDRPCGEFADDISETGTELGVRHGKRAREVLAQEENSLLDKLVAEIIALAELLDEKEVEIERLQSRAADYVHRSALERAEAELRLTKELALRQTSEMGVELSRLRRRIEKGSGDV